MRKVVYESEAIKASPVEPLLRQHLILLVSAYAKFTGYRLSTLAVYAQVSGDFFQNLIKSSGRVRLSVKTYDSIVAKFADKWPKGLAFPSLDDAQKSLRKDTGNGKASKDQRQARAG
jgi:hypothetical protein